MNASGGIGSENNPHEIYLGGELYDEATFNSVILEVADSFGNDVALQFAQDLTGYSFVNAIIMHRKSKEPLRSSA